MLSALAGIGLLVAGYFVGGYSGIRWSQAVSAENQGLEGQLHTLQAQLKELRRWRTIRETREQIEGVALGLVREELAAQQTLILELEEGIRFYKSLTHTIRIAGICTSSAIPRIHLHR